MSILCSKELKKSFDLIDHILIFEFCPLCHNAGFPFYKNHFYQCTECGGIFRPEKDYPAPLHEKHRYLQHNNDVFDPHYREFVSPVAETVKQYYSPEDSGLDYGAGTGPVIAQMLKEHNYEIELYDPFFYPKKEKLEKKYDYIICCEVMEHFHRPDEEFQSLKDLLKPDGRLICMTDMYHDGIDFKGWTYKNDRTHVFIYQRETINWLGTHFHFRNLSVHNRLIVFQR